MIEAELNKLLKNLNKCVEALRPTLVLLSEFAKIDIPRVKELLCVAEKIKQKTAKEIKMTDPIGDHYDFSVRVRNCLRREGVQTLGDLTQKTEQDLISYRDFGPTCLREVTKTLEEDGFFLKKRKAQQ